MSPLPGEPASNAASPPGFWALKPWWCQPWSLLLTGTALSLGSWLALHRLWVSALVSLAVLAWWGLFLVLAPLAYRQNACRKELRMIPGGRGF